MMKKFAISTVIFALSTAPVFAAQQGGFSGPQTTAQAGGFVDKNHSITTIANAKEQREGTWVRLQGNITERVSDDTYIFKDASGTINVDIDHKYWKGITVAPQDLIEIQGEVDKDWRNVEIDVKQINKINP